MVRLWESWCRLCAKEDQDNTHIHVHLNNTKEHEVFDNINHIFSVEVNKSNSYPVVICVDCYQLIKTTINLKKRVIRVNAMFAQLLDKQDEELDLSKFKELHNLENDFEPFTSENITLKPKDELSDTCDHIIDHEFLDCKTLDSLPMTIKMENEDVKAELERTTHDGLASHSIESSDESYSSENHKEDNDHKMKKKNKTRKERWAENQKKPFSCLECLKGFLKLHNYRRHMQITHGIEIEIKPPVFICENCGKEYKSISALKEHEHCHTEERKLKCKYCEKTFKGIPSLRLHEDTHNETNYICVVCGLQLNTQRTLRMHMLVHSDKKKHKCDFCGNEYKRAKALKTHLILHAGLKPYSCDFCDKTFANGANCRSHKRKYHPAELAQQEASGRTHLSKTVIPKLRDLKAVIVKKAKTGLISASKSGVLQRSVKLSEGTDSRDKYSAKEEPDFFQTILGPMSLS